MFRLSKAKDPSLSAFWRTQNSRFMQQASYDSSFGRPTEVTEIKAQKSAPRGAATSNHTRKARTHARARATITRLRH
jgi:hypothetical protein